MAIRPAEQIIHKAAWLYYAHGLRQDQVAQQLNISRASVAMYLRKARETGIVNISTSTQLFTDDVLARQLEDALKLDAVWIAPQSAEAADPTAEVPVLAASVFLELVKKGDRIGVAWGRTVYSIADIMSYADLQDVTVVQLCGNLGAPYSYRPDQCTMEIARRLNARGLNFYAPLVLTTEKLARELRAEPVIREQLAGIPDCDLALYSIGTVDADSHVVKCGALSAAEMDALRRPVRRASSPGRSSTPAAQHSIAATTAASSPPISPRCAPFRNVWWWCRRPTNSNRLSRASLVASAPIS